MRDHVFLFVNMFLLYFIGEGTRENWQGYHTQYHAAWALILANVGLQYIIEYRRRSGSPEHVRLIRRMAAVLTTEAAIVALAIPFYNATGSTLLTLVAILFGICATVIPGRKSSAGQVDFAHLSERAMLYVVFTFGEMIIAIAGYFEGRLNFGSLYFSLMGFLIVVGLFLSYGYFYDRIIDREKKTNGLGYMLMHIFIIFALNNITTSLEFMRNEEISLLPKMLMLTGSFVIYYVFLFSLGAYAGKRCGISAGFYLTMAVIGGCFIGLMLVFRRMMYVNIAMTVMLVFGVLAALMLLDRKSGGAERSFT